MTFLSDNTHATMKMTHLIMVLFGVLLISIGIVSAAEDRIKRVGNKLAARATGVDDGDVTFLLNDIVPSEGVLFVFSAYFRGEGRVRMEVWRPLPGVPGGLRELYELIASYKYKPTMAMQREDIYIESLLNEDCVLVTSKDRVGVFFEESPGSVAYSFDSTNPKALASTLVNASIPNLIGDEALFDSLTFPYDFSIAAYIDTNLTGIEENATRVACPKGLLIPEHDAPTIASTTTTTTLPPTGAPGLPGPPGPPGFTGQKGEPGFNGTNGKDGKDGKDGTDGVNGVNGTDGRPGAAGIPGAQGVPGPRGEQGPTGLPGARGPAGPAGGTKPGPNDASPVVSESNQFSNPWLVLAALIWLALLTLIVVIVIVLISHAHRKKDQDQRRHAATADNLNGNIYVDPGFGSSPDVTVSRERILSNKSDMSEPQWIAGMKEESESQFSHDTIERQISKPDPAAAGYVDMSAAADPGNIRTSEIRNY